MAKRNKRHSNDDWDYEWTDNIREEESRRAREEERRAKRERKSQYTHYDWDDEH